MTTVAKYKAELESWQNEYERQKVQFVITEDNLYADKHLPASPTVSPSPTMSDGVCVPYNLISQ